MEGGGINGRWGNKWEVGRINRWGNKWEVGRINEGIKNKWGVVR